jgi:hypothetical protein
MKNAAFTLFLAFLIGFSLSTNVVAEGNIGIGGRSCPPNTTCITEGDIPHGGKSCPPNTTCLTEGDIPNVGRNSADTRVPAQADEATIFKTVLDYLAVLFG